MAHYYSEKQEGSLKPFEIKVKISGAEFSLLSAGGVFSKKELDTGTKVLIENCIVKENDFVLDIGCGYGALGIAVAKLHSIKVLMADVNERAVLLARMNAKKHSLKDAEVRKSYLYDSINEEFDVILSNPPQTAGKEVCFKIIEGAFSHLKKGGSLQLVARPNKGGKTLANKMKEVFGNVKEIARASGFAVYLSRRQ